MTKLYRADLASPVGPLHILFTAEALRAIVWTAAERERLGPEALDVDGDSPPLLDALRAQLDEYFAGRRTEFDLPLEPLGTEFQLAAWKALRTIPFGETRSYGEQARAIGRPTAVRAIGAANGQNPISIVVPCHRVIGSDGSLTGFGGGIERKRKLLDFESRVAGAGAQRQLPFA